MSLKKVILFLLVLILSLLVGSVFGRIAGLALNPNSLIFQYVSVGVTIDLPLHLNLNVLLLDLYLGIDINAFSILGMILGGVFFFRLN